MSLDNSDSIHPLVHGNVSPSGHLPDHTLDDLSAGGSSDPIKKLLMPIAQAFDDFLKLFK